MLTTSPVESTRDVREFLDLPRTLYPRNSPWVRPLDSVVRDYLDRRKNPFYRDGAGTAFLVRREGPPVGRILCHTWNRYEHLHGERPGFFGFFECVDDADAAEALFAAACEQARRQGCRVLRGPFNMTAAQEIGLMVEGFDRGPGIDMVYTPSYYPRLLERAGFHPCFGMDTWANPDVASIDVDGFLSERHRVTQRSLNLRIRPLDGRKRREGMDAAWELINAAFLGNWSFVPITHDEWTFQVGPLIPWLDPSLVLFASIDDVPVGVTFAVPDFNEILRHTNGSLVHPRATRMLRRPPCRGAVIILFAVRKQYQGLGVNRMLNAELVRSLNERGYRTLVSTWVAAENEPSRAQLRALGMRPLHRLAMYERSL